LATFSAAACCSAARKRYGLQRGRLQEKLTQALRDSADVGGDGRLGFLDGGEIDVADLPEA
jgi:hypothetical protein